ncbi:MAG: NAD(P)/FAD-dependent oxidoreductase, partial [Chitinophagaceae bacterium]
KRTLFPEQQVCDVAIIGGGLAGLALSIQLARSGHSVVLFEKERYPFHRVCGEYISLESRDFLQSLGVDLAALQVSSITRLQVSTVKGRLLEQELPLGGFGISRYRLDDAMAVLAREAGVQLLEQTKISDVVFRDDAFVLTASGQRYQARVACGSYGKRGNLDIRWKRPFASAARNKLNNYIGVKYHIRSGFPVDTIALHLFRGGYCGIVKVEGDRYCLCYLTSAANLQQAGGSIPVMEQTLLSQNPFLKKIFAESGYLFEQPVTISQISFDHKTQVEEHVLLTGDAAGMITPLCGNGMSMALHGSKLAAEQVHLFLHGRISRTAMERQYASRWQQQFGSRLKAGRLIQRLFGHSWLVTLLITAARSFPQLIRFLVRQTHGRPF